MCGKINILRAYCRLLLGSYDYNSVYHIERGVMIMITMLSCMIAFVLLGVCFKIFALLFGAAFTVTGFFLKLAFGIICGIISAVVLFSVIGAFALLIFIPAVLVFIMMRRSSY